jgi:predicted RNA-binding protein YlqC (UPF0109 family)
LSDSSAFPSRPLRLELQRLISFLVDEPDKVRVFEDPAQDGIRFEVNVAQQDLGKVIGRQGRTARALRTLLEVRGDQDGRRYGLDIRDS